MYRLNRRQEVQKNPATPQLGINKNSSMNCLQISSRSRVKSQGALLDFFTYRVWRKRCKDCLLRPMTLHSRTPKLELCEWAPFPGTTQGKVLSETGDLFLQNSKDHPLGATSTNLGRFQSISNNIFQLLLWTFSKSCKEQFASACPH